VFGFSTENWSRPAAEVSELMGLFAPMSASDLKRLEREGSGCGLIGRRQGLPADIAEDHRRRRGDARRTTTNSPCRWPSTTAAAPTSPMRRPAFAEAVEPGEVKASDLDEAAFEGLLSTSRRRLRI
jgi:undecaprenyl diphosphate synthase